MNTLKNKVSLIGRLGQKPEVQEVKGGYTVARFSLATNERFRNKAGEYQDETQWHAIKVWGKLAQRIAEMTDKGVEILLEGRLVHQQYQSKSGETKYSSEIELKEFMVLGSKENQTKK